MFSFTHKLSNGYSHSYKTSRCEKSPEDEEESIAGFYIKDDDVWEYEHAVGKKIMDFYLPPEKKNQCAYFHAKLHQIYLKLEEVNDMLFSYPYFGHGPGMREALLKSGIKVHYKSVKEGFYHQDFDTWYLIHMEFPNGLTIFDARKPLKYYNNYLYSVHEVRMTIINFQKLFYKFCIENKHREPKITPHHNRIETTQRFRFESFSPGLVSLPIWKKVPFRDQPWVFIPVDRYFHEFCYCRNYGHRRVCKNQTMGARECNMVAAPPLEIPCPYSPPSFTRYPSFGT